MFKRMGVKAGVPDVLLILPHPRAPGPLVVWFEVKSSKGRLSTVQKSTMESLTRLGCWCFVIVDVGEAEKALRSLGVPLRATTGVRTDAPTWQDLNYT